MQEFFDSIPAHGPDEPAPRGFDPIPDAMGTVEAEALARSYDSDED